MSDTHHLQQQHRKMQRFQLQGIYEKEGMENIINMSNQVINQAMVRDTVSVEYDCLHSLTFKSINRSIDRWIEATMHLMTANDTAVKHNIDKILLRVETNHLANSSPIHIGPPIIHATLHGGRDALDDILVEIGRGNAQRARSPAESLDHSTLREKWQKRQPHPWQCSRHGKKEKFNYEYRKKISKTVKTVEGKKPLIFPSAIAYLRAKLYACYVVESIINRSIHSKVRGETV